MPGIVPVVRPQLNHDAIRIGKPPSAQTHMGLALLLNWLHGRSATLVPTCFPERLIGSGTTETFRFRVKPRATAIQRVWILNLRTTTTGSGVGANVASPSGGTARFAWVAAAGEETIPFVYVQNLTSKSSTEAQIEVTVAATGGTVIVDAITCYEQDRAYLDLDSTDYGVNELTMVSGSPIQVSSSQRSYGGAYASMVSGDGRRVGILQWSVGDDTQVNTTSGSFQDVFLLPSEVLVPKRFTGDVTGAVLWSAYARVDTGTAEIRVTTTGSGVSDTVTISNTSFGWLSNSRSISIDCDDMSADDGLQGSAFDDMQVAIRSASGGARITIQSFSCWMGSQI